MTGYGKITSTGQRWLLFILISYIILGFAYSIVIPLAETPDESEHFRYLQTIVRQGKLPIMLPDREANLTLEAHQPPLYYLLGSILTGHLNLDPVDNPPENLCFSFEPDDLGRKNAYLHNGDEWPPQRDLYLAFYIMRWLSVLMGAVTVFLAYVIGRQAVPTKGWFGPIVAAIVAFNPQFIFITASMNNDVPTVLLGTAIVVLSVSAISGPRISTTILLGIVVGLGLLTKFALIAFWPLAILAVIWPAFQISRSPFGLRFNSKGFFYRLLIVTLLPMLIAGWWYYRNYLLYGDPLMWEVTLAAKGSVIARTSPFALVDLGEFATLHFQSFWIWFGWLNIRAPKWIYGLIVLLFFISVFGLLRWLVKRNVPVKLSAIGINAVAVLAIYASLLRYIQTINWTGYQGRLAFAALAPIALFIALGFVASIGRKLTAGIVSGFLVLAIGALLFILLPSYPRPENYQLDSRQIWTCARFDGGLQIEAADSADKVFPGDFLPVTIHGYGLADSEQPQLMSVYLREADGEAVGQSTIELQWQAKEEVTASVNLLVPKDVVRTRAVLDVAMVNEEGDHQTATSATGRILDVPVDLKMVKISPVEPYSPTPTVNTSVHFGDQLTLIGYDVDIEPEPAITLYWKARKEMPADYTTFIHIVDADGQLVAQTDSQPAEGVYPTSIWDTDEIVADRKVLGLAAEDLDQSLQLFTGVYLLQTLERLPVSDASGQLQPNSHWPLELPAS